MRLRGHRGTHAEPDKVSDPHADRGPDGRADRRADGAGEDALADSPSYYASDGTTTYTPSYGAADAADRDARPNAPSYGAADRRACAANAAAYHPPAHAAAHRPDEAAGTDADPGGPCANR